MISKTNRLDKKTFEIVMKGGRVVHSSLFTLRFTKNSENKAQLAVVAPKSVEKLANKRNSLRRKGYNAVRPHLKSLKGVTGIVFIKKEAKKADSNAWQAEIGDLMGKTH